MRTAFEVFWGVVFLFLVTVGAADMAYRSSVAIRTWWQGPEYFVSPNDGPALTFDRNVWPFMDWWKDKPHSVAQGARKI